MNAISEALDRGLPATARHFSNAHFLGMNSIVLADAGGLLTRMFLAKPGELDENLQHPNGSFLWHAHECSFTSTTVAGMVVNHRAIIHDTTQSIAASRPIYRYSLEAGITSGNKPTLSAKGVAYLYEVIRQVCYEGESYGMPNYLTHRVTFHPCQKTGWFGCVIKEIERFARPRLVYSLQEISDVPFADDLYKEITSEAAMSLLREFSSR